MNNDSQGRMANWWARSTPVSRSLLFAFWTGGALYALLLVGLLATGWVPAPIAVALNGMFFVLSSCTAVLSRPNQDGKLEPGNLAIATLALMLACGFGAALLPSIEVATSLGGGVSGGLAGTLTFICAFAFARLMLDASFFYVRQIALQRSKDHQQWRQRAAALEGRQGGTDTFGLFLYWWKSRRPI